MKSILISARYWTASTILSTSKVSWVSRSNQSKNHQSDQQIVGNLAHNLNLHTIPTTFESLSVHCLQHLSLSSSHQQSETICFYIIHPHHIMRMFHGDILQNRFCCIIGMYSAGCMPRNPSMGLTPTRSTELHIC